MKILKSYHLAFLQYNISYDEVWNDAGWRPRTSLHRRAIFTAQLLEKLNHFTDLLFAPLAPSLEQPWFHLCDPLNGLGSFGSPLNLKLPHSPADNRPSVSTSVYSEQHHCKGGKGRTVREGSQEYVLLKSLTSNNKQKIEMVRLMS